MKVQYHVLINYTKKQKKILKEILHLSEYNFSEPVDGHREGLLIREDITLSNLKAIEYKRWHEQRRKERFEIGVWKNSDKSSNLLGFY